VNVDVQAWKREEEEPFVGWDFSALKGRMTESSPPWDYLALARAALAGRQRLLDLGTGGGERLLELKDAWPPSVTVTEGHPPNVALAAERLTPLGVSVVEAGLPRNGDLPFADGAFDLVLNRHSGFSPRAVSRVLAPGGVFLTQQVHGRTLDDLRTEFGVEPPWPEAVPESYGPELEASGLRIRRCEAFAGPIAFHDVGALVFYLRAVPWTVPGFTVDGHRDTLLRLHQRLAAGPLVFTSRLYLIEAVKVGRADP
jgi:SAM-dependent methyltransferase